MRILILIFLTCALLFAYGCKKEEALYTCISGNCVETDNGDYASKEDCQSFCRAWGDILVWTSIDNPCPGAILFDKQIEVFLDGSSIGTITENYQSAPLCGSSGTLTKEYPVGTYNLTAKCSYDENTTWGPFNVTINEGSCTRFEISETVGGPYACINGNCSSDPSGTYATLSDCQNECSTVTCPSSVSDIDGNTYLVVRIGNQCWTASNLKTLKYRDGTDIPNIPDDNQWIATSSGAWCYYDNNSSNNTPYGKLYNWDAINDSRGICPTGWHVPTDAEWSEMTSFISSVTGNEPGNYLKTTTGWQNSGNGNDQYDFSAYPAGNRFASLFEDKGELALWWTATDYDGFNARTRMIDYSSSYVFRDFENHWNGLSCRCVMD
ncbi:MAG: fibrobacter succinogenes major paralogous domain-containing protein [Chitinophagales bacterium]